MKIKILTISIILCCCFSCNLKDKKTSMAIIDPERHYYPVLRGQTLDVVYEIENTGDNPLFIHNIQTSCGCILIDESSFKVLPSGRKGFIKLEYNSNKNIGYVKHYVTIYANLEESEKQELSFDLHIVPNALYTRDYEELYRDYKEKNEKSKYLVDGNEKHLGYYVENLH